MVSGLPESPADVLRPYRGRTVASEWPRRLPPPASVEQTSRRSDVSMGRVDSFLRRNGPRRYIKSCQVAPEAGNYYYLPASSILNQDGSTR